MWSISSISQIPLKRETISAINNLHIFNPEHDYALAVGNSSYTPPASVIKLKKRMSLLPALYAGCGDFILISPEVETPSLPYFDYFNIVKEKKLKILTPNQISDLREVNKICPWGWNHHILKRLQEWGVDGSLLPSVEYIDLVRKLSHRRTSINFRSHLYGSSLSNQIGAEIFKVEDVMAFIRDFPYAYFKAPWSSSGRGVVSSIHVNKGQLKEWAHGIIRRQGSVLAEPGWNKKMDFASEWMVVDHQAQFLGLSVFYASPRGKYHGNIKASQKEILNIIQSESKFSFDIIEAQREVLNRLISPYYDGPLGIDMLVDKEGDINPCVEINLRLTMGHVYLTDPYH